MTQRVSYLTVLGLIVLLGLSACESYVQTSSGGQYLQHYRDQQVSAQNLNAQVAIDDESALDGSIVKAAGVEPILTFPARIGLARIDKGRLTAIPPAEAGHWQNLAEKLGNSWGEFVPISPLIAAFTQREVSGSVTCGGGQDCIGAAVQGIRLGAARQHVDAVLIYEATAWSKQSSNPLAIGNITLIGLWLLPSQNLEAGAAAQALLLDVRNGYTYGFAQAEAHDAAAALANSFGAKNAAKELSREAEATAVAALVPEVETMLRDLRLELAEKRLQAMTAD